jgi:lipopolysaccharide transport system ATP-binding protein
MSSEDFAIRVRNLSKTYQIYETPRDRLMQFILPRLQRLTGHAQKRYYRDFHALDCISFDVNKGETVGIIGRNGSGKSTLLQLICGTLNSTSGSVQTIGRIAAILELGSGFNPEFTGRENVHLSCALLGLTSEETEARFDDIAAFADIGDFLDQPVKTYSSGMFVRLAFAVNISVRPDIMIVDEALAVGDMSFQAKCMTSLRRIQDSGATVLFVSHDIGGIKSLCSRALFLEHGQMKALGKASIVAEEYVRMMREEMNAQNQSPSSNAGISSVAGSDSSSIAVPIFKSSEAFDRSVAPLRYGIGTAKISFVELLDMDERPVVSVEFDQKVKIRIHFTVGKGITLSANYYILDDKKNLILGAGLRTVGRPLLECKLGSRHVVTYTTCLPLQEGNYSIQFQLSRPIIPDQTAEFLDVIDDAIVFNVQRKITGRIWTKVFLPNSVEVVTA